MPNYIQVITTAETKEDAQRIAAALVERRLAACVQVAGPITSTFRWEGKVQTATEWQCIAKTRGDLYARVETAIRELHPYQVPEIVATPIASGSQAYLDWIDAEVPPQSDNTGGRSSC
ncbi:MAG: divalent-cation tolerance protein CutA [Planctomycetia bacterium]|nr:divalent-cation tolerance protein CutA [Planctomycetia bacterium]